MYNCQGDGVVDNIYRFNISLMLKKSCQQPRPLDNVRTQKEFQGQFNPETPANAGGQYKEGLEPPTPCL